MASRGLVRLRVLCISNYQLSRSVTLSHKVIHRSKLAFPWCTHKHYCSSSSSTLSAEVIRVDYQNGLPVLAIPLPSRREKCQFIVKPFSNTLGDLMDNIQGEDRGVDRVTAHNTDGIRIARATPVDLLMSTNFHLTINEDTYLVETPNQVAHDSEHVTQLHDIKSVVAQLYSALNVDQHQLERERDLLSKLEHLQMQLEPLEKVRQELQFRSEKRTGSLAWLGLGMMGLQFGLLARLTWWEYSWDIMEPITYFVTYGTAIGMAAYYVVTKQDYNYPEVRDRQYLLTIHKNAQKVNFDMEKYNSLKDAVAETKYDLQRLRDPLQLQLPIQQLERKAEVEEQLRND